MMPTSIPSNMPSISSNIPRFTPIRRPIAPTSAPRSLLFQSHPEPESFTSSSDISTSSQCPKRKRNMCGSSIPDDSDSRHSRSTYKQDYTRALSESQEIASLLPNITLEMATIQSQRAELNLDHSKSTRKSTRRARHDKPPRPRNSFMIFRNHWLSLVQEAAAKYVQMQGTRTDGKVDSQMVSMTISTLWSSVPDIVKDYYIEEAQKEKEAHGRKYPGYKYQPRKPDKSKLTRITKDTEKKRQQANDIARDLINDAKVQQDLNTIAIQNHNSNLSNFTQQTVMTIPTVPMTVQSSIPVQQQPLANSVTNIRYPRHFGAVAAEYAAAAAANANTGSGITGTFTPLWRSPALSSRDLPDSDVDDDDARCIREGSFDSIDSSFTSPNSILGTYENLFGTISSCTSSSSTSSPAFLDISSLQLQSEMTAGGFDDFLFQHYNFAHTYQDDTLYACSLPSNLNIPSESPSPMTNHKYQEAMGFKRGRSLSPTRSNLQTISFGLPISYSPSLDGISTSSLLESGVQSMDTSIHPSVLNWRKTSPLSTSFSLDDTIDSELLTTTTTLIDPMLL